jgi:hypothetical protein
MPELKWHCLSLVIGAFTNPSDAKPVDRYVDGFVAGQAEYEAAPVVTEGVRSGEGVLQKAEVRRQRP